MSTQLEKRMMNRSLCQGTEVRTRQGTMMSGLPAGELHVILAQHLSQLVAAVALRIITAALEATA
jgi:hypothetical protein